MLILLMPGEEDRKEVFFFFFFVEEGEKILKAGQAKCDKNFVMNIRTGRTIAHIQPQRTR